MAAKAFCVLVFHVLCRSALSLTLCIQHLFQRPISDKDAKLYQRGYVGTRSFTLHTSSLRFLSWLHRDAPERACPSHWERIENMISARFPRPKVSNGHTLWTHHTLFYGTIISNICNSRAFMSVRITGGRYFHKH